MHKLPILSLILILPLAGVARAQDGLPEPDRRAAAGASQIMSGAGNPSSPEVLSYALGLNIGNNLRSNQAEIDVPSMMAGITDGLRGAPPKWPEEQLAAALQRFQEQMQRRATIEMARIGDINKRKGDAFLSQNRKREGVQETPSGLQYKVLKQGSGPSPTLHDFVRCQYRGTFMDGTEFDSSYSRGMPAEFAVRGVIPGWTEALQKMHVGDKWQLFVPADLAYGTEPPDPAIEPNSLLIFEIELLDILQQ